jgi:23S rRNA pseudouridine2605 synthase
MKDKKKISDKKYDKKYLLKEKNTEKKEDKRKISLKEKPIKNNNFGKKFDKASKYSAVPEYIKKKRTDKKTFEEKTVRHNKISRGNENFDYESKATTKVFKRKNVQLIKPNKKENSDENGIRLNKYIANAGISSRREADTLISTGVVSINGKIVTELGTRVQIDDIVKVGEEKINPEKKIYVLLNKPKDYITTLDDPKGRKTVLDLVKDVCAERIYPVGRLDRNTTGLLLLTNDGELTKKLTHPKYNKKKIYHVFLETPVEAEHLKKISIGIELEDGFIKPDKIDYVGETDNEIGIELHSGKNRIVRRIFEHFGYSVKKLDRVYYVGLTKKNLPRGKWRLLSQAEITRLQTGMYE